MLNPLFCNPNPEPKFQISKFLLNPKSWNFATRFRSGRGFACGGSGSPTANMTLIIDDHCDHVHEIYDYHVMVQVPQLQIRIIKDDRISRLFSRVL